MPEQSLYVRVDGYDAITTVANGLLPRLINDEKLGRFWDHRGDDRVKRVKHLLIDFLCEALGGAVYYTGRHMKTAHSGMRIDEEDWQRAVVHPTATLDSFDVPEREKSEVLAFVESTKPDIVGP